MVNTIETQHFRNQIPKFFSQQNERKILRRPGIEPGCNCLEGSYAHHYTNDTLILDENWQILLIFSKLCSYLKSPFNQNTSVIRLKTP